MSDPDFQTLLQFFKVMANESRLKLVGILTQQECSVEELAALLQLKEPTISHHLAKLREVQLVQMRPDGNTHFYRLDTEALLRLNKSLLAQNQIESLGNDVEPDAWEAKVLHSFIEHDRLKEIPASRRKRWVILKWLARQFDLDTQYPESTVNEIIHRYHADAATLRREMVGYQMMQREHGVYWRSPETEWRSA
jgi:DNA-binding transcriptional ArsR family regulator